MSNRFYYWLSGVGLFLVVSFLLLFCLSAIRSYSFFKNKKFFMSVNGAPTVVVDEEIGILSKKNALGKLQDIDIVTDNSGARVNYFHPSSPSHVDLLTIGCSYSWGHKILNEHTFTEKVGAKLGLTRANFSLSGYAVGGKLIIFYMPFIAGIDGHDTVKELERPPAEPLLNALKGKNIVFVDARPRLLSYVKQHPEAVLNIAPGDSHPNELAHQLFADSLEDAIRKNL